MSRGRKKITPNGLDWEGLFNKSQGVYFQFILSELGKKTDFSITNDTGAELLEKIKAEKAQLIKAKKLKAEKDFSPIKPNEIPFEIPKNWVWCRLGEMSINCDGERIPISQSEREKKEKIYDYYGASGVIDKIDGYTHDGKYLLIGEDGANLKAKSTPIAFIAEGKFWVNNHAHVLNFLDDTTLMFMEYCLNAVDIKPFITGGFQPKLSQGNLNIIPIPLPPLSEQERIVEFMQDFGNQSLIEDKEYFDSEIEEKVLELHESQLMGNQLSTELTHQLDLVKQLRQSFLREAMQGKLVAPSNDGETGQQLLEKIKAEKAQLIAAKKLKKDKDLPPIKTEEIPFEIPEHWTWCRLGEVGKIMGGGTPSMSNSDYWDGNIPWVSPKDMWTEYVSDTEMKVTMKGVQESSTNLVPIGSLLIVGRSGILKRKLPVAINIVECTVNQDMKVIVPYIQSTNRFLQLLLWGLEGIVLKEYVKFGMTVHSLKYDEFAQMPIPFPPLSEQQRIVEKLESLMQTCDALEASIKDSQVQNQQLLQQVLREALKR